MPNRFSLTRRSALADGPVSLQQIDKEICEHFFLPCSEEEWHHGWYNYIGFHLAMGWSFERLGQDIEGEILCAKDRSAINYWGHMQDILNWLAANFTPDAWAEIGKR
jgi:hypothetical protein